MEGYYEVTFGQETVGKVQVVREGLYYRFVCRCRLKGDTISKLVIRCGNQCENLGVLIPAEEGFILEKKHPVKKFGDGEPFFYLAPRHDCVQGKFVPIYPEEPFGYIAKLNEAFLASHNGQTGALLKEDFDYELL